MNSVIRKIKSIIQHDALFTLLLVIIGAILLSTYWAMKPISRMKLMHKYEIAYTNIVNSHQDKISNNQTKAQEIPVLLYHGILTSPDDGFSINKQQFSEQMRSLYDNGYIAVSMGDYIEFLSGKKDLPERSILITFDDGRKDSYYRADPILKKYNFHATMFLATGYSLVDGSRYYVDKHEVKEMKESGRWDIESHSHYAGTNQIQIDSNGTMGNFYGNLEWLKDQGRLENLSEYRDRVAGEMKLVRDNITSYLSKSPQSLSFPFGDYGQASSNKELSSILLEEAKKLYDQVFVQFRKGEPYSSNYHNTSSFISRRIEVDPKLSGADLVSLLKSSTAKPLPFDAKLDKSDGWKNDWGKIEISNSPNRIILKSTGTSTSAEMYLDGTRQLSKYSAKATMNIPNENTVVKIIALYKDGRNYIGCSFSNNVIKIEQYTDGNRTTIMAKDYSYTSTSGIRKELGIVVGSEDRVSCYSGEELLISAKAPDGLVGGPAIIVWNQERNLAVAELLKFNLNEERL